jgi:hypothetical protein
MMNPFGNSNLQAGMYMSHPEQYQSKSDQELLRELQALGAYGSITPPAMMLLAEICQRAQHAFAKTFVPTKAVHGDRFLYTSIFKDGLMTHLFAVDSKAKENIEKVLNSAPSRPFEENLNALIELGPVFDAVPVDENGTPVGDSYKADFRILLGFDGFNKQPLHVSKTLPLAVVEFSFTPSGSFQQGMFNEMLLNSIRAMTNDAELVTRVDLYLRTHNALLEYKKSADSVISDQGSFNLVPVTTQIHFFPVDQDAPLKFISKLYADKDARFVDRHKYPQLFVNPNIFNRAGPTGFGNGGQSW